MLVNLYPYRTKTYSVHSYCAIAADVQASWKQLFYAALFSCIMLMAVAEVGMLARDALNPWLNTLVTRLRIAI